MLLETGPRWFKVQRCSGFPSPASSQKGGGFRVEEVQECALFELLESFGALES